MSGHEILVIDDSATILKVVQLVLSKAGHRVRTALDGEEGLRLAKELRPDLILLDFVMPKMNGYQVCRAIAASGELKGVPVVLMSGKGDQVGERFVKVMGIVDYITKPFSPEALNAVVVHVIEKYGIKPEAAAPADAPVKLNRTVRMRPMSKITTGKYKANRERLKTDPNGRAVSPTDPGIHVEELDSAELVVLDELDEDDVVGPQDDDGGGDGSDEREDDGDTGLRRLARGGGVEAEARRKGFEALREAVAGAVADDALLGDDVAERVRETLRDEILEGLIAGLALGSVVGAGGDGDGVILSGNLAKVPIAEVLTLLQQQRQTGVLTVERGPAAVEIWFRGGKVDFTGARGLGEEFLLGNYIVEREAMSKQDLELFFRSRGGSSKLCGEQLVKLNYITADDLQHALARQTAERIYEVLRWSSGRFGLRASVEPTAQASQASLQLSVEGLLMEGFRRIDEWHLIEREIDDFDMVFLRNEEAVEQMGSGQLSRDELAVLEMVNAKNSVRDIVRQSRMGAFEVSQMLYRLRSIRLIRRRVQPVAV